MSTRTQSHIWQTLRHLAMGAIVALIVLLWNPSQARADAPITRGTEAQPQGGISSAASAEAAHAAVWSDVREDIFPAEWPLNVQLDPGAEIDRMIKAAPEDAHFMVMTHSHALDFEIVERALKRADARFVGMIGSETKAAKLRLRLGARGVDASRLVSPIGLFKGASTRLKWPYRRWHSCSRSVTPLLRRRDEVLCSCLISPSGAISSAP